VEVERAAFTFSIAAEEAKRIYGEIVPLDWIPGNDRRVAHVRRIPLGPIAGITPFNFPLNLVVHKVAPALAAGNPIVIRPASQTPVSALKLGQIVVEAGWPEQGIAVVPSSTETATTLVGGDPLDEGTDTGALIDDAAAERVEEWLKEAVSTDAQVLTGGAREGRMWQPTVLTGVADELRISCQEAFAPLVVLSRYEDPL